MEETGYFENLLVLSFACLTAIIFATNKSAQSRSVILFLAVASTNPLLSTVV